MKDAMHEFGAKKPVRNIWWIFLAIVFVSVLGWFGNTFTPSSLLFVFVFLLLIAITSFCLLLYLLNNVRRSILGSLGLSIFLALRYLQLREVPYLILLGALLLSLELYFQKR